jgi:sugar phosphate isomerase/epimerase
MKNKEKTFVFKGSPALKLGFSTQNFLKCLPHDVKNITEILQYASKEGYEFIELRDPEAGLSLKDCKELGKMAESLGVDVLYEINTNLLAPGFLTVYSKGLENTLAFPGEGIIRTLVSNTEFASDETKKGWTEDELNKLIEIAEKSGKMAKEHNLKVIVENANESFFGKGKEYYGFADLINKTKSIGIQFDTANPFQNASREKADPLKVEQYLASVAERWITTHLKSGKGGVFQPVLDENALDLGNVISVMAAKNVRYVAFELLGLSDKEECFKNHSDSIQYLINRGLVTRK